MEVEATSSTWEVYPHHLSFLKIEIEDKIRRRNLMIKQLKRRVSDLTEAEFTAIGEVDQELNGA